MEPRWLTRQVVDLIHHAQRQDHGGNVGVLQNGSVESEIAAWFQRRATAC